jgi:phage FluMu protein Com
MATSQTALRCKWCKTLMVRYLGSLMVYCPHCDVPCPDATRCPACRRLNHQP